MPPTDKAQKSSSLLRFAVAANIASVAILTTMVVVIANSNDIVYRIDWGNAAEWATWVVAAIALVAAFRAARAAISTDKKQTEQLAILRADALARHESEIRMQADQVSAWLDSQLNVNLTNASTLPVYDVKVAFDSVDIVERDDELPRLMAEDPAKQHLTCEALLSTDNKGRVFRFDQQLTIDRGILPPTPNISVPDFRKPLFRRLRLIGLVKGFIRENRTGADLVEQHASNDSLVASKQAEWQRRGVELYFRDAAGVHWTRNRHGYLEKSNSSRH